MKSQVSSQVFVYIMAVIIAGLIIVIGGKAIVTVLHTFHTVNIEGFKSEIQSNVRSVSREYGSVRKIEPELSATFDEVCFADSMIDG